jgi:hypothetical protein
LPRIGVGSALVSIVGLAHRDVERELVVQIALEPPVAEQGDDAVTPRAGASATSPL